MHRSTALAAAAAFVFASISPAAAHAGDARLIYADLNLNSAAGAEVFNARVRNAARQACGERFGPMTLREHMQVRACKRAFIEDALAQAAQA